DEMIRENLATMIGTIAQRPSSVSAVKIDGERAYDRVRAGEKVELPSRQVSITQLDITRIDRVNNQIHIDIEVTCSAGTYIRAIARDCGDALGVGGHLSALRRTRVGAFDLAQSISLSQLKEGEFTPLALVDLAAQTFPVRNLALDEVAELSFGRALTTNPSDEIFAAISGDNRLIALLTNRDERAKPITVFAAAN
ncbi:MAG: tRNA pseudouridine(55) synthase TruB, partial [Actinobacteria bacterium]|nr:tRNA pseudouridine(55) synthase TruB [Actinomycetota bacterium]